MNNDISLSFKGNGYQPPTHMVLTIPLHKPLAWVRMPKTPGLKDDLLDKNFAYIRYADTKISVVKLNNRDEEDSVYFLVEKIKKPAF